MRKEKDSAINEQRIKVYQEIQSYREAHDKEIKFLPEEQFKEFVYLKAKWDMTHGEKWDRLNKTAITPDKFLAFYKDAFPLWKKLQAAQGNKVCEAFGCMKNLPEKSKLARKYCSDACKKKAANRRCNQNSDKKTAYNVKSYGKKYIEAEGITEKEIKTAIKVFKEYKGTS